MMSTHRQGSYLHEAFRRKAGRCLQGSRSSLVFVANQCLADQRALIKAQGTQTLHYQLIITAARVYQNAVQKATKAPIRQAIALRVGTKSYRVFETVVNLCATNKWLIGEYISAQFEMLSAKKFPLIRHLATEGAIKRYLRFSKMLNDQQIRNSTTTSEKATIERVVQTTCANLVTLLLARKAGGLTLHDFPLCDRYTLAYLYVNKKIPDTLVCSEVAEEIDLLRLNEDRWATLNAAVQAALATALSKLQPTNHNFSVEQDTRKRLAADTLNSLYIST